MGLIEIAEPFEGSGVVENGGARWNQQANREMDRVDVLDETVFGDEMQQSEVTFERFPRRVRKQRRAHGDAGGVEEGERGRDVFPSVVLLEVVEDDRIQRFDGGDDEDAA